MQDIDILEINFVLIIAAVIFLVTVIVGGIRGFIRSFFAAFSVIIAIVVAAYAGPYVGKMIQQTPVYSAIETNIEIKLDEYSEAQAEKVTEQIDTINGYPIPDTIKKALIENNNHQIYEALGVDVFNEYIAAYMACLIINALSFLLVLIFALILLKVIETSLGLIGKLPILHGLNTIGGVILGGVHGMIVLWILCIVVTIFSWTEIGGLISEEINDSVILKWIYDNNYLISILTNMSKMLF